MSSRKILKGGEFLFRHTNPEEIFIAEEFNEEQLMIAQTCEDFLEAEVFPNLDRIDSVEPGLMRSLISKSGELGLLGISIPAEYEGFDQSFLTSMRANEAMGAAYSFSVAYMAHTGIGTLPILYYGNEFQRHKYIPKLSTGEWAACYCLTEPNAGSDANAGKSIATLSEDGQNYILNGQKMWITNGGFADIFTVFAKISNDRVLSAFIIEKDYPGVVIYPEEKKMGIKGSSTVQVFFNDVKVPVENLLGKRGEGFRIALNILHIGRIKLAATVLGAAKRTITQSVNYANERKQFGYKISDFGAIKYKLAEQVIKIWVTESAVYRASKDIDDTISEFIDQGMDKGKANIEGISQYGIECAFLKVFSSEALDYVVDEAVQIYGGMGFSAEAPVDRAYRDSRINRIFEGTNEINRLLAVDLTLKRGLKGEIDLFKPADDVLDHLSNMIAGLQKPLGYFEEKRYYIQNFKNAILLLIAAAARHFNRKLEPEQEIVVNLADMITILYAAESTLLRVEKIETMRGSEFASLYKDILDVFVFDASNIIYKAGLDAVSSFAEGEQLNDLNRAISAFTQVTPLNVKVTRRRIADKLIEDNQYKF
jgi:alkylation response protein AidB-like acyl-CoA dehydrogenase